MEMVRIMTTSFISHLSVLPVFFLGSYHKVHLVRWSEYRGPGCLLLTTPHGETECVPSSRDPAAGR